MYCSKPRHYRRNGRPNLRTREYLTEVEVERLMAAAKGRRDATMILVAYRLDGSFQAHHGIFTASTR